MQSGAGITPPLMTVTVLAITGQTSLDRQQVVTSPRRGRKRCRKEDKGAEAAAVLPLVTTAIWCLPARRAAAGWEARLKTSYVLKRSTMSALAATRHVAGPVWNGRKKGKQYG